MILQPIKKETAFLKAGILGFAGSGKTHTAMLIAMGTVNHLRSKKPIAILDTEAGTDFWISRLEKKKIEAIRAKSRAFQDLMMIVGEAEKTSDILIIDSISHIWKNFLESYMKRLNRTRLQFQDWNVIKPEWGKFTDVFLNSKLHIIMCGRAGWEYDYFEDETGKKELMKTGTKMKAESEMGYEPSLLLEMERVRAEDGAVGQKWIHRCHVLKDRADVIDGKMFDDPTFECFLPHFQELNIGGEHLVLDMTRTSEEVFDKEGLTEDARIEKRRKILLEEIEGILVAKYPSTSGHDKQAKLEMVENVFDTKSWTKISMLPIATLENRLDCLKKEIRHLEESQGKVEEKGAMNEDK